MCTRHKQRGISLIELIMFIVIVSVALAGILLVMNVTTRGSADPLIHKQALAAAESLLEEIELQDFSASGVIAAVTQANRVSLYHIVSNYNGFPNDATTGIYSVNGLAITGLENYNANVTVANAALGGITAVSASAVLVTVTIADPQGNNIQISGYRTAY
jgi:MSHA pilin protein MshD